MFIYPPLQFMQGVLHPYEGGAGGIANIRAMSTNSCDPRIVRNPGRADGQWGGVPPARSRSPEKLWLVGTPRAVSSPGGFSRSPEHNWMGESERIPTGPLIVRLGDHPAQRTALAGSTPGSWPSQRLSAASQPVGLTTAPTTGRPAASSTRPRITARRAIRPARDRASHPTDLMCLFRLTGGGGHRKLEGLAPHFFKLLALGWS